MLATVETYYSRLVSQGNLDNPSRDEAAQDLAKAYAFIYIV